VKIRTKIVAICFGLVALSTCAFLATVIVQRHKLSRQMQSLVQDQAKTELGKLAQSLYYECVSAEVQNQARLTHDLAIARETLAKAGQIAFDTNTVKWDAVNQVKNEAQAIELPRFLVGGTWLGQNTATNQPSPVVDDVRHLTRDHCTIFQRMNDDGDMLRVDTSVVTTRGGRAIGTYIPHRNADGSPNPVVASVLRGETYRGRAFVVNEYHDAAYEPIWDVAKTRIIGMLYVGMSLTEINKQFHDSATNIVVGKTGYVYVLDSKGTYIVSQHGERDGESIWNAKDTDGRLIIQDIIEKARGLTGGSVANVVYSWKSKDQAFRRKFATFAYFAPWDWIISASAYEDDYQAVGRQVDATIGNLIRWSSLTALGVGLLGLVASYFLSSGLVAPIVNIIGRLNYAASQTASTAQCVAEASQSLAGGASQQAASIEETSASLEELTSTTQRNAQNAGKATGLAKQTRAAAESSAAGVQEMNSAMAAIKGSSDDITKIIRTIDELAFQTKILALNAAIEAARAGEAGLGFAVVAGEVGGLAQRSTEAAREIAGKIESAIANTAHGVHISSQLAQALGDIVVKAREVDSLVEDVSRHSAEQSRGISQINTAVSQMDKVIQANAASAEESAAAAEEFNAQAAAMKEAASTLTRLIGENGQTGKPASARAEAQRPRSVRPQSPAAASARENGRKLSSRSAGFEGATLR
jgi:hypothetical protein